MTAQEDPFSLLEELKQRYGVEESAPPHGSAVIVPNSEYKPEWTRLLNRAGVKIFLGDRYGRVAWIIPLKARVNNPGEEQRRGCITGRPWTMEEDSMLVEEIGRGRAATEIARDLAAKMNRTEDAVKGRVRKLRRRPHVGSEPTEIPEEPRAGKPVTKEPPASETGSQDLRSLLESALILSEDPRHRPALKLVLEACLRKVRLNQG